MDNEKSTSQASALQPAIDKIKELLKNKKIRNAVIAGLIIIFALGVTLALNTNNDKYTTLYTGLDTAETTEIFSLLKMKGADPKLNDSGEVMVLTEEFDIWLLQLSFEGYPKSGTPNYSYYADNIGMTTTQSEQNQWALYQLQESIATTLKAISGISDARVTITLASTTDYVWDKATNSDTNTVGVMLTPTTGTELSNEQVMSLKNLVAASVPKVEADQVKIINSRTSLEMGTSSDLDGGYTNVITALQNYELEAIVQSQIEANVLKLLTYRYGNEGVVATAKVTLNYDKMISESLELIERPTEDGFGGGGFATSTNGYYGLDGTTTYGGIVGEEDNTDIPTYPYGGINDTDVTYYTWNTQFDYSYIKSQIEAGYAELERVTISVLVDEQYISDERRIELVDLISKSIDVPEELISVSTIDASYEIPEIIEPIPPVVATLFDIVPWYVFAIAGALLLIIIILVVVLKKRAKKKREAEALEAERLLEEQRLEAERMIDDYKKNITSAAKPEEQDKQEAIIDEIRDFTTSNPDIATGLIKGWLKEEEQ